MKSRNTEMADNNDYFIFCQYWVAAASKMIVWGKNLILLYENKLEILKLSNENANHKFI